MLWRFRREVVFIIGLLISVLITKFHSKSEDKFPEDIQRREISLINYEEILAENRRLKEILNIKQESGYFRKTVVGQVLSIKPYIFPAEIVVNKGTKHGIEENMTVISKEKFLIGRVVKVDIESSFVATIFNKESRISVMIDRTREIGILEGGGAPLLCVRYIPCDSKLQKGDKILTSGYSDFYPKGIKIGEVEKVEKEKDTLFLRVYVKPYIGTSAIEEVLMVR